MHQKKQLKGNMFKLDIETFLQFIFNQARSRKKRPFKNVLFNDFAFKISRQF